MNSHDFLEVFLCGEYEKLLDQCQQALEAWSLRSEQIRQSRLTGDEVGRELLRLQAYFAKMYCVLQKHTETCPRCQLASRSGVNIPERNAVALSVSPS
jgi:hypothetical protein